MRRIILSLLCLLLLSGCAPRVTDEAKEDLIVVGVSQLGAESDWRVANSESVKASLSEKNGFRLIFDDARQKQENQLLAVRKFIQQRVDYIVVMPLSEVGWDSVLLEAKNAGIPVILVDRAVRADAGRLCAAHIGSDFLKEGRMAVKWLEENALPDEDGTLHILHVQGTPGSSAQLGRTAALEEGVERHEDWTLMAQLNGDFTYAKTYSVTSDYLRSQPELPDIDVVYCENDNAAFGAIRALEDFGYECGPEGVTVISFDATRAGLRACFEGSIALDVECNPLLGPLVAQVIGMLERGATPQSEWYVEEQYFERDTLTSVVLAERPY